MQSLFILLSITQSRESSLAQELGMCCFWAEGNSGSFVTFPVSLLQVQQQLHFQH